MVLEEVTGKVLPRGFASPLSDWGNPLGRWSQEPAVNDDKDREEYILRLRWWQRDHKYLQSDCGLGLVFNRLLHWRLLRTQRVQNRDQNLRSDINNNGMLMVMVLKASITLWKYLACISIECATLCFYHPNFVKPSFGEILSFDNIGILFSTTDSYLTQHFPRKSRK